MKKTKEVVAEEVLDEVVENKEEKKSVKKQYAVVKGGNLNFRKDAEVGSEVLVILPEGTKVEVIQNDKKSEWAYCKLDNGVEAYAMKQYLSFE